MDQTFIANGIVLDKQPWGERDSKVFLYTREYGRLDAIARGSRAILSKLNGHLEPFNSVELMIIRGRNQDYIGGAISRGVRHNLISDLRRLVPAGRVLSKVKKAVWPSDVDPILYDALESVLDLLNHQESKPIEWPLVALGAEIRLLSSLGFAIDTDNCQLCAAELINGACQRVSGELVCPTCARAILEECPLIKPVILANLRVIYKEEPIMWPKLWQGSGSLAGDLSRMIERLSFYRN